MALISGQPTPISTVLPGSTPSDLVGMRGVGGSVGAPIHAPGAVGGVALHSLHDGEQNISQGLQSHGETQSGRHTFSGLPTPGTFLSPFLLRFSCPSSSGFSWLLSSLKLA